MRKTIGVLLWLGMALAPRLAAQQPPPPARGGQQGGPQQGPPQQQGRGGAAAPGGELQLPPGRWWDDPNRAQSIGLTPEQVRKMDDIFNASREHLIDLDAAVQKSEAALQPLLEAQPLDRAKVLNQIDRLAEARADLEKATAQMLLDIRLQLSPEQWQKLQTERPPGRGGRGQGGGGETPLTGGD